VADIDRAVEAVVRDCLGVKAGEELLVVCDPGTHALAERLRAEGERLGADAVLALMGERATSGTEPPAAIAAAMAAAGAVLAPTTQSLSHTAARKAATDAGVRIATLPGVTEEVLARVMSADMDGLRRRGRAVAGLLSAGSEARLSSEAGSDLRMSLEGRTAIPDAGELTEPGAFGNLPCGEGFIAPVEGTAEGTLVVDGSMAAIGKLSQPATLRVERGHLVEALGEEGAALLKILESAGPGGTNVAELGIGTNERATLTGNVIEDEKLLGTAHVAFGASAAIGGTVQVPIHLDCVVLRPTVEVDGQAVVRNGELLV
jgi:leucyl aminopeptidase (aminopeptidase T)